MLIKACRDRARYKTGVSCVISWVVIVGILGCFVSLPIDTLAQPGQVDVTIDDAQIKPSDERISLLSLGALLLGALLFGALGISQKMRRSSLPHQRKLLLQQIASLDDQYALGKIEETMYRHRRRQLKKQAIDAT
jgi:hypothetical protein